MRGPWLAAIPVLLVLCLARAFGGPMEEAKEAETARRFAAAADLYAQALKAAPENLDALLGLIRTATREARTAHYPAAAAALEAHLERGEGEKDARLQIARGDLTLGRAREAGGDQTARMMFADAEDAFWKAYEADPALEEAAVGIARARWSVGNYEGAVEILDEYLAREVPHKAQALHWKGRTYYTQAVDAFRASGSTYPLAQEIRDLFSQAEGSFQSSSVADPSDFDTWIHLAYSAQYLSHFDQAAKAYESALAAAPESTLPIEGLNQLYANDAPRLAQVLNRLQTQYPDHPGLLYYRGHDHLIAGRHAQAAEALEKHVAAVAESTNGWYLLGQAYAKLDRHEEARRAWKKAVEIDPRNVLALNELERPLREQGMERARKSVAEAQALQRDYQKVLDLSPRNADLLNNLAFILREAYGAHANDPDWLPVLEASRDTYLKASEILGEYDPDAGLTPEQRYAAAQVISDTGLMFQFYPQIEDLERAESFYLRALDFTDTGYFDAFNNLQLIYEKQKRSAERYDLAAAAADRLTGPDGSPHAQGRALARGVMKSLEEAGVTGE